MVGNAPKPGDKDPNDSKGELISISLPNAPVNELNP